MVTLPFPPLSLPCTKEVPTHFARPPDGTEAQRCLWHNLKDQILAAALLSARSRAGSLFPLSYSQSVTTFITDSISWMRRVRLSKLPLPLTSPATCCQAPCDLGCELHTSATGEVGTGLQTHGPVAAKPSLQAHPVSKCGTYPNKPMATPGCLPLLCCFGAQGPGQVFTLAG